MVLLLLCAASPKASLLGRRASRTLGDTTRPTGPRSTQPPSPSPSPQIRRPRGSGARGGLRERTGENFYVDASENSVYIGAGWWAQPVPGALAGRPEMVLPLEPFAYSRLGGSGELLGGSEGGPEGARGRSWESPRATFRGSEGSVSGLAEVCWHISGSSGHLGSWLSCREHDSSWFNIICRGLNSSSKYS